jgi:hypothetical protein
MPSSIRHISFGGRHVFVCCDASHAQLFSLLWDETGGYFEFSTKCVRWALRTSIGYASRAAAYTSSTGSVHPIVPIETLSPLPNGLQDQVAPWRVHTSIRGNW